MNKILDSVRKFFEVDFSGVKSYFLSLTLTINIYLFTNFRYKDLTTAIIQTDKPYGREKERNY